MDAALEQRIANLPLEKRALLERRIQARLQAGGDDLSIPRRETTGLAPLSFSQERLWFLAQLYPGQTTYNEGSAYRLRGPLDVLALQAALDGVVQRHEVLRTTYHSQDGGPMQVIEAPRPVPLSVVDLSGVADDARVAAAQRRFVEVIETPFDLTRDLMLRACLYRLGDGDHILLAVRHHIASDAWSGRRFWNEIGELYAAETAGRPARLPSLPIQYADYSEWQRNRLQGERLERQVAYWREQLAGLPPLQLPTDRRRPETLSFRGAGERFELEAALVEKLQAQARGEGTTLHTLLMTAYAVLLARTAGQDDIAVGVPVAGRVRAELEPLIGFFINTLVIRARLGGNPPFRELLRQTQRTMLAALDHQDLPFEKLVEMLEPERHLNRSPLIATTFQVRSEPAARLALPQLTVDAVDVPNLHAKFDMECSLVAGPDGVAGHWRYATDLFEAATIRRMIGRYQTLLAAIVDDPDRAIGQLPLLTAAERWQILTDWSSGTPGPHPPATLVHELFEAQVRRTPDALAVVAEEQRLTYRALNARANQVAHRLQEAGVGPETAVGLYLDRTAELVVGMLGVLKAGGAFVPLDMAAPPARLQMLAEDAGLRVVLTTAEQLPAWPATGATVECLDGDQWERYESGQAPPLAVAAESAAYILHTSGSTGKPKGVVVEHRQLMSYVLAAVAQYGMAEGGQFAMVQPLTVDSCHTMIFPALGWGGTLHLIGREMALDATALGDRFQRERPDFLKIAPSHLQALMSGAAPERLLPQRCLVVGGETFHWDLAEQLLAQGPACAIWNHYGPTETTVGVLTYPVTKASLALHRGVTASVPLGRPLPGVRVHILDSLGNPVPIGTPGELCIGGPLVARGYLNRPEQTAAQFREDELADEAGARRYYTGDTARWLADGVVEFLGRDDDQVKIRGVRVVLGEIEAVLGEHAAVAERCVLLRQDGEGAQPVLVAYVSPGRPGGLEVGELDAFLRARLPEVMVPAAYVVLEALPRTAHGKIDRAALPAPGLIARVASGAFVPPRSPEEEAIAAIWCEVLRREQVGIHDNFFELGGHSLLATQIIARIGRTFDVEVPVRTLFEKPTVSEVASAVKDLVASQDGRRQKLEAALAKLGRLSPEERAALLNAKRAGLKP